MNKDNAAFFNARKSIASCVYASIDFKIGTSFGWTPDLLEAIVDDSGNVTLRLIELEAKESDALVSSRKYLPESPSAIIAAFHEYLERVIRACRSSADTLEEGFAKLKAMLEKAGKIHVTSACAQRNSLELIEELPLLNQSTGFAGARSAEKILHEETPNFSGTLRLNGDRAAALGRAVLVLDAIVREEDHSDATFKAWRGQDRSQPLKRLLKKNVAAHSYIRSFISEKRFSGTSMDCDKLTSELAEIWSKDGKPINRQNVQELISSYFPTALRIRPDDRMQAVFDGARKFLSVGFD